MSMSSSSNNSEIAREIAGKTMPKKNIVASFLGGTSQKALKHISPSKHLRLGGAHGVQMVWFLLKVASLEGVRRISRTRCPFVWRAMQALQILCCPPFRWMKRWAPLRMVIEGVEKFSTPLLLLSIATVLFDHSHQSKKTLDSVDDSQTLSESPKRDSTSEIGDYNESIPPNDIAHESWSAQLLAELAKQGITLPKRIDHDELQRFHAAANGDFSFFFSSIKKTILWRENYNILSSQELKMWSHLVFWHGFDLMLRPCLIIRLGLAYSSLKPHARPRFAQAVVSQIEHGILHLVNEDDSRIEVLIDCEGLLPSKFPMNMMRSCSTLVQNHYPNRLAHLFVVQLPPDAQVPAHNFVQSLKPVTRQKVHVEGETYLKVLYKFLPILPAFLGGNCSCSKCRMLPLCNTQGLIMEDCKKPWDVSDEESDEEFNFDANPIREHHPNVNWPNEVRSAVLVILLLVVCIAFLFAIF